MKSIAEMTDELQRLVTELYQATGTTVQPMYPYVLIRVLPKEQMSKGGVVLTGYQQNKPVGEAVVLGVYREHVEMWESEAKEDGQEYRVRRVFTPAVAVGDHVLFQAVYGIPVPTLDGGKGDYRLLNENDCISKLKYERESVKRWLRERLWLATADPDFVIEGILEKADVIRRDVMVAKTVSGR